MNSLYKILNKSSQSYYNEGYLFFELSLYTIKIGIEDTLMPFLDDIYFHKIDENFVKIIIDNKIKLNSIEIIDYEDIENREFVDDYSSLSKRMYFLVRIIHKSFLKSIDTYKLYIDYGDEFCGVERYFYSIKFNNDYIINNEFIVFLTNINVINYSENPKFYSRFFTLNKEIKDLKELKILSTNTKVRRLGYFKLLSLFLENKKIPATSINKKFELFCLNFTEDLIINENSKGLIIQTKTGISSKPYVDTAVNLDFLNKINNIYSTGKSIKVYQVLNHQLSSDSNIFKLNNLDKIFFLENILKYDFFYFRNLLEIIYINEKISYSEIINIYPNKLVNQLKEFNTLNDFDRNRKVAIEINTVLKRIVSWEKPEKYLEHVIMPRLNWMLDLELIKLDNKNNVEITEIGNKLFENLCIWDDINKEKVISPNSFIDLFMIHIFDNCYNNDNTINVEDLNYIKQKTYSKIDSSFEFFKTLAPNRVTASQAINYTKYKLYFDENIKVGFQYIKNKLEEKDQDMFIFKYQDQYEDGYIQRKNK
jgi:hypothetical protein